jgi:hypothetical protein
MSQYKDIPQPTDQRNVSQNDILTNYQYLATSQGGPPAGIPNGIIKVDHEQFGNNITNPKDGFHNQVSFLDRNVPTNLVNAVSGASSDSILYTKADGAGISQMRFKDSSIDSPVTYLKALVLFSGTGAILGNTHNVNNPGGVVRNSVGKFTINFSVPFPAIPASSINYLVFIQSSSVSGSRIFAYNYTNKNLNSITVTIMGALSGTTLQLVDPDQTSVMVYELI